MIIKTISNQTLFHALLFPFAIAITLAFTSFSDVGPLDNTAAKEISISIDVFSGRPNPELTIDNPIELDGMVREMKEIMKGESISSFKPVKSDLSKAGYRGVILRILAQGKDGPIYFRLFNGLLINNKLEKCFSDKDKLEEYLVRLIMESPKTKHQIKRAELRDRIIKKSGGVK